MARKVGFSVGVINIAMHNHKNGGEDYINLIKKLYSLKTVVRLNSTHVAILGSAYPINKESPLDGYKGEILHFINIDPSLPWFNKDTLEEASAEDLEAINIPENLSPNMKRIPFIFFPKGHRFYVITAHKKDMLGIKTAEKILRRLTEQPVVKESFGDIELTVEPDQNTLEHMLTMEGVSEMKMTIVRPNPDDDYEIEAALLEKLRRQNQSKEIRILLSDHSNGLKPDSETKKIARVAASNGAVTIKGKSLTGEKFSESTEKSPRIEQSSYQPELELLVDKFLHVASKIHQSIRKGMRKS